MEKFNGKLMKLAFEKATEQLLLHEDELNALNVFPVPDGDTGSNMLATMKEGCKYLEEIKRHDLPKVMEAIKNGTLMGARGNSGVILSQVFRGFAEYCGNSRKQLNGSDFVQMFKNARNIAYSAVMKPVEGTILTVLRRLDERSEEASELKELGAVFEWACSVAEKTVEETPKYLPILKEAGVVDAGAKGLLYILKGFLAITRGDTEINLEMVSAESGEVTVEISVEQLTYQYCTELVVKRNPTANGFDVNTLRAFLDKIGDSSVVVHDGDLLKVHVHTDHPGQVIEQALTHGEIVKLKVDNMRIQHEHMVEPQGSEKKKMGIVAVSPGTGLSKVLKNLGVDKVIRGGQTMNPSTADIKRAVDTVAAENVFVFPNNPNIILAAKQASQSIQNKNVIIIPTQTVQECISAMMSFDPNEEEPEVLKKRFEDAAKYVISLCITRAVRDSKYNGSRIKKGEYMVLLKRKLMAHANSLRSALAKSLALLNTKDREVLTIFTGQEANSIELQVIEEVLKERTPHLEIDIHEGGQPHYPYLIMIE